MQDLDYVMNCKLSVKSGEKITGVKHFLGTRDLWPSLFSTLHKPKQIAW